ncbi:MAG TPA: isochorismatase family cysteine hydrolase [Rhodanobacteraceae bacterium]|jgi:nicotinamidase-related amidase
MADALHLDPHRTAVLCMDFQTGIVQNFAGADADGLLDRTAALLDSARAAKVRVGHVKVGFRPGYPEVSPNNLAFSTIRSSGRFEGGAPGSEIHPSVAPQEGEFIVTKHRYGAFPGTDLDMILRANGVDTLVLAGISTSGVVLSTVRHAADADYRIVVVADCCADPDAEVHRVLTGKVFPKQARVANSVEVIAALRG